MKKCLVTKLKAKVERDDLPVLGALRVYFESIDGSYPFLASFGTFKSSGEIVIKFADAVNQFTTEYNGREIGSTVIYDKSTSEVFCKIYKAGWATISSKYDLTSIGGYGRRYGLYFFITDFNCMSNLTQLTIPNLQGDIADLNINKDIVILELFCDPARGYKEGTTYGDIANLSKYVNIETLAFGGSSIKGNITNLYTLIKATEITIARASQVYGDIKILADRMYQAGRTSGTLKIWTIGSQTEESEKVTYDGKYFNKRVWTIVFSADGHSDTNTTS